MNASKIAIFAATITASFTIAQAAEVPSALTVEWEGNHPCEKLFEDAQVRVARCTFSPGTVHVCHSHPSYLTYVLSGGQGQVQDDKGTRKIDVVTGAFANVPPIPWHEFANIGDTTIQYVVVEKKYEAQPSVDQSSCPKREPTRQQ
jgi:quercetin dioxygenase-like cupin family protein